MMYMDCDVCYLREQCLPFLTAASRPPCDWSGPFKLVQVPSGRDVR